LPIFLFVSVLICLLAITRQRSQSSANLDLETAPFLDNWEFRPRLADPGGDRRVLALTGRISGDERFAAGENIFTSEVEEIDRRSSIRWTRTRSTLYRLGAEALGIPLVAAVALANDWTEALTLLALATGEHTLDEATLATYHRLLEVGTSEDWTAKRLLAGGMAEAMDDAQRFLLRDAWRLLGTDPRDQASAQTIRDLLTEAIFSVNDGAKAEAVLEAWAAFARGNFLLIGDEQDHIARAQVVGEGLLREKKPPLFVRMALQNNWTNAWSLAAAELPKTLVDEANTRGIESAEAGARIRICGALADAAGGGGDGEVRKIISLLSIDPALLLDVNWTVRCLNEYPESDDVGRAREVWRSLADWISGREEPAFPDDAFASARMAYASKDESDAAPSRSADAHPEEPPGLVVLPRIGGTSHTTAGKEVRQEFKSIVGERLPFATASDLPRLRAKLTDEFPHLMSQIDVLLTGLVDGEPIRMPPTLLVGEPGVGKGVLARRLCHGLGVLLHRFDGSGSSDNAFGGTPRRWSTGEHCVPLEAVRRGRIANPFVLVDEIDKAGKSHHNGSLDRALLPFLESETPYPDPYLQTEIFLSSVNYLLTANDATLLPAPSRDRLRIVVLPQPSIEHLPQLARSIVTDVGETKGGDARWFPPLEDHELAIAETLWRGGSVRRLRAVVERLLAYREQNPRN
jgi:hypothetical protein